MSTTALPQSEALRRNVSNVDSTPSSTTQTPLDSPRQSPSSTSLSSMNSDEMPSPGDQAGGKKPLFDTFGNEFEVPDYTIKQLRDAIPAHCFQRSAALGLFYVARDVFCLATTFLIFHNYVTPETVPSYPLRTGLWALYTVIQGLFGTGLWVLAHECGHQSFSPSKTLNDTVGWFCHSALLVPYFSWKISHGKHHKATGHIERDMVFCPPTREIYSQKFKKFAHELHELTEDTPIATLGNLVIQQIGGWPTYLLSNVTGHNYHERQTEGKGAGKKNGWFGGVNHFNPLSPLYERKDEHLILLSDLGIAITIGALVMVSRTYGFNNLAVWYLLPYLWVNNWLVAITFLQHTDGSLPHYTPESWTFAKGAAATIDRNFWPIGPYLFHGIIETHVLHHYISTIPFYHADEATEAIKPVMGRHYRSNTEGGALGFVKSLWKSSRMCQWVEEAEDQEGSGVLWYRNKNGLGTKPKVMEAPKQ